jgi:hypothetical protein
MKNEHLLPVNVIDLGQKLMDFNIKENERSNYELRLEAIRDYCTMVLNTYSRDKSSFIEKNVRSKTNFPKIGRNNV